MKLEAANELLGRLRRMVDAAPADNDVDRQAWFNALRSQVERFSFHETSIAVQHPTDLDLPEVLEALRDEGWTPYKQDLTSWFCSRLGGPMGPEAVWKDGVWRVMDPRQRYRFAFFRSLLELVCELRNLR